MENRAGKKKRLKFCLLVEVHADREGGNRNIVLSWHRLR
jgi:hypothetical protein